MITDAEIRAALKSGRPRSELKDPAPRGEGRLALQIRRADVRVTAEWYAIWYREGRRKSAKLGSYPSMSLGEARRVFKEAASPAIVAGEAPMGRRGQAKGGATVLDLFEAYVRHLEASGKHSAGPRKHLLGSKRPASGRWRGKATIDAATAIGRRKLAKDVTPQDIIPHLRQIRDRGAISAAAHARAYVSAAFSFAMQSANAYHRPAGEIDWGVDRNPVSAIPFDPSAKRAGNRHLSAAEVRDFWRWLEAQRERSYAATVLLLCVATGQRLTEINCLTPQSELVEASEKVGERLGHVDLDKGWIYWPKTKSGAAHALPLPRQAVEILKSTPVSSSGLYFPNRRDLTKPLTISAAEQLVHRYLEEDASRAEFTPRDLRRTWKTLAGEIGLSKEIRDRLQNHSMSDVSARHYDRWTYAPEKTAAMEKWSAALDRIIFKPIPKEGILNEVA